MTDTVAIHRPTSVSELAATTLSAYMAGHRLLIRGGGTHQSFANAAEPHDGIVQMSALDAVIDYSLVDLTLAVQAGRTLSAIDELLRASGQRLAVDAPRRESATIGGLFASGLSGPSRLKYGSLKDVVIGAEVLNSSGEVTKSGGMVVKNVSGYELARLHYGAHGAFGFITRLNLKVSPLPEVRSELQLTFRASAHALDAGARIVTSALDPTAVYVVSGAARDDWTLHVVIEGSRSFVSTQLQRVETVATSESPAQEKSVAELEGAALPSFDAIADLTSAQGEIVCRLSVPASQQASVLAALSQSAYSSLLADIGSGIVYVRCDAELEYLEHIQSITPRPVFLALPEPLKSGLDVFGGADEGAATLLRRLKNEYDPTAIFNQGRFVLGL